MDELKNTVSASQKKAQKKYDQKTKMLSVKYTPYDMNEYEKLKLYLQKTGQSANGFIKKLIKDFFASGKDYSFISKNTPSEEKQDERRYFCPFSYIAVERIEYLYDTFGKEITDQTLTEYYEILESNLENLLEEFGNTFDEWSECLEEDISTENFEISTQEETLKKLKEDLNDYF